MSNAPYTALGDQPQQPWAPWPQTQAQPEPHPSSTYYGHYPPQQQKQTCTARRGVIACVAVVLIAVGIAVAVVVTHGGGNDAQAHAVATLKSMMDTTVQPCQDFYQFACGTWMRNTVSQLNMFQSSIVYSFTTIENTVDAQLSYYGNHPPAAATTFLNGCNNLDAVDNYAWANNPTIRRSFQSIDAAQTVTDIFSAIGTMQYAGLANGALFIPTSIADFNVATTYRAWVQPYAFNGFSSQPVTTIYSALSSAGFVADATSAYNNFNTVNLFLQESYSQPRSITDLTAAVATNISAFKSAFNLPIDAYFSALRVGSAMPQQIVYYDASFFTQLSQALAPGGTITMPMLRDWLKFHVVWGILEYLPTPFRTAADQMYDAASPTNPLQNLRLNEMANRFDGPFGGLLNGPDPKFLKKMGIKADSVHVGHAVERAVRRQVRNYVRSQRASQPHLQSAQDDEMHSETCQQDAMQIWLTDVLKSWLAGSFPSANKPFAQTLVTLILSSMQNRLSTVAWLDSATRAAALQKQGMIVPNVAYDDPWLPTPNPTVLGIPLLDKLSINAALNQRLISLVDTAVRRNNFPFNTPLMSQNAFYQPTTNTINMLPGLMYPPFFDPNLEKLFTYAPYGMVIGHEITHGFDNNGRLFDGVGAYRNWWSANATTQFDQRAQCLVNQYSSYQIAGMNVNGNQTLGENIADNGGIGLSWNTYKGLNLTTSIDSQYSNDQLFFLTFAQTWCEVATNDAYQYQIQNDVHSPSPFRVQGPLSNFPPFAQTWGCADSTPYGRSLTPARCEVW